MARATYLLAIDQGTTGSTALVVRAEGALSSVVGRATVDFPQHFPRTGWVEHDLEEIWKSVGEAVSTAISEAETKAPGFVAAKLAAIGVTNQRETLCVFERATGMPLHRAVVWQCKRSADICARLRREGAEPSVRAKTGLVLDPYFSGTKITWLMENAPEVAGALKNGRGVVGTIDTFLMARLSGNKVFATEASNASRTLLFDIDKGTWDAELLDLLRVPGASVLPEVKDSAGVFGTTKGLDFLPDGIPIAGVLGDQQAALAGQACYDVGEAKCTYGTGAFLLLNLGAKPLASRAGLLTTVAWQLGGKRVYAFEGSAFIAGAAVQFLRDQLGIIAKASESEALVKGATAAPEVYFVPALSGLGAPYWDPKAQGAILGLTRGTTRGQIVRATLEGIAFQVSDLIQAMRQDYAGNVTALRVDGGAAANDVLMQAQADYAGVAVDRPMNLETTAFGAALFAGLGAGVYASLEELRGVRRTAKVFNPVKDAGAVGRIEAHLAGWKRAVHAVRTFAGT